MEPVRPRAVSDKTAVAVEPVRPRTGTPLHVFGIWHICPLFATIRLFSLLSAHFRDAKFWRQQSANKFCGKSGNVRSSTDGWWIGRYVLMPDHVHFFARPASDARPKAGWVGMWKSVSSRRIAPALSIKPPIWQADYFDRFLRSSESYSDKWQYVEQNPVRAGLVGQVEDWPYRGTIHDLMF